MRLTELSYSEHEKTDAEWVLDNLTLQNVNLLVGRNASGKTRTLNVISSLSLLLSNQIEDLFQSGHWRARFEGTDGQYLYELRLSEKEIRSEILTLGRKTLLERGEGGRGRIRTERTGRLIEFHAPSDQIAAVTRQDEIQHPFFAPLIEWAHNVVHYKFGATMGHDSFLLVAPRKEEAPLDPRDTRQAVRIFDAGSRRFGDEFRDQVIKDMEAIGYSLADIGIRPSEKVSVTLRSPFEITQQLFSLYVQEKSMDGLIEQTDMSQGMFRALSIIVQVNYLTLLGESACILVDDVGEGLDYERSSGLVGLLISKSQNSEMQLVMSTNDRFIMNAVPLRNWTVLSRDQHRILVFNMENSADRFEEFRMTGLNNFDFFATDFVLEDGS